MNLAVPDIPRLYTAIAEWAACFMFISMLPHRFKGLKFNVLCATWFVGQSIFLHLTGDVDLFFWIPCMIIAVAMMFLFIVTACNISIWDAGFYTVRAFVLAELVASLEWQVYLFFYPNDSGNIFVNVAMMVAIFTLCGVGIYWLEKSQIGDGFILNVHPRELWAALAMGLVVFAISNSGYISFNGLFAWGYQADVLLIRTMVDFAGYAMLFAYHVQCYHLRNRHELDSLKNALETQYVQYQQSRESIELINHKYHDLKHQIAALRAETDPERRNNWLDAMEEDIYIYEAQNKTGNAVLDTVITSKALYCKKHGITFTCVVDGALLNFMDVRDLCTLFGNALDNAIESVKKISDKEKRLIHLSVAQQKGFVLVRVENYYEGAIEFKEGMPITTKKDKNYHGYGLKSMKYSAKKYGGTLTISTQKSWFELKVLFPMQN